MNAFAPGCVHKNSDCIFGRCYITPSASGPTTEPGTQFAEQVLLTHEDQSPQKKSLDVSISSEMANS
jgi:hypothetical protein